MRAKYNYLLPIRTSILPPKVAIALVVALFVVVVGRGESEVFVLVLLLLSVVAVGVAPPTLPAVVGVSVRRVVRVRGLK